MIKRIAAESVHAVRLPRRPQNPAAVAQNRLIRKRRVPDFVDNVASPVASALPSRTAGIAPCDVTPANAASNADDPRAATSSLGRIADRDRDGKSLDDKRNNALPQRGFRHVCSDTGRHWVPPWNRSLIARAGSHAVSREQDLWAFLTLEYETVPQSVPESLLILAKCWSEWQDLNLRPPRPERGAPLPPNQAHSFTVIRQAGALTDGSAAHCRNSSRENGKRTSSLDFLQFSGEFHCLFRLGRWGEGSA